MAQTPSLHKAPGTEPDPIRITRAYEHVLNGFVARETDHLVSPVTTDPGGPNTISTYSASILFAVDQKVAEARAKAKECHIHLDWRYGPPNPKFTTRHLLVLGSSPTVGFAGGTAWYENVAKASVFRGEQETMSIPNYLQSPAWTTPLDPRKSLLTTGAETGSFIGSQHPCWQEPSRWTRAFSPPELLDTPRKGSPGPEEDQLSVCSDPASVDSTFSEATTPSLYTPAPSRQNSSSLADINGAWMDLRIQQQFQSEAFQQQKKQAEDLYVQTGDVSGLISVMNMASQFSNGGPSIGTPGS
ncbi:hypothetical protein QBC36DRAFT_286943 [Triangularia setosa]|uniref:Uncharacterized protein n=1 Tax=Triangularia setosa TaxID=2587417 RepID=A0AAN6WHA0_9PEZI|nr:hypothetical protein QBC36DRAFT_286943 [Podospora setosa]